MFYVCPLSLPNPPSPPSPLSHTFPIILSFFNGDGVLFIFGRAEVASLPEASRLSVGVSLQPLLLLWGSAVCMRFVAPQACQGLRIRDEMSSPALAGGFFTREPQGGPPWYFPEASFVRFFGRAGSRAAESRSCPEACCSCSCLVASLLLSAGSRAHGLSSYSPGSRRRPRSAVTRGLPCPLACSPPGPGIKPASPALAGDPLSTVPSGNSELVINFYPPGPPGLLDANRISCTALARLPAILGARLLPLTSSCRKVCAWWWV